MPENTNNHAHDLADLARIVADLAEATGRYIDDNTVAAHAVNRLRACNAAAGEIKSRLSG